MLNSKYFINLCLIILLTFAIFSAFPAKADIPPCTEQSTEPWCKHNLNPTATPTVSLSPNPSGPVPTSTGPAPDSHIPDPGYIAMIYFIFSLVILAYFIGTLAIELPIMYWLGFKNRHQLVAVAIANLVSVPFLQITTRFFYASTQWMEGLVIAIEFIIIKLIFKSMSWKKILLAVFVANLASFLIGYLLGEISYSF